MLQFSFLLLFAGLSSASWFWSSKKPETSLAGPSMYPYSSLQRPLDFLRPLMETFSANTHTPRIVKTPHTFNIFFDLPGFSYKDLNITVTQDDVHIQGHTTCPSVKTETSWLSGEQHTESEKGLCVERLIDSHVLLPRSMHEHGNIRAILENGVLRILVPLHREEGKSLGRKMIEVLTGTARKPIDSASSLYEDTRDTMYHQGRQVYEQGERAYEGARHAGEYVYDTARGAGERAYDAAREAGQRVKGAGEKAYENVQRAGERAYDTAKGYGEEYVSKPIRGSGEYVAEKVRDAGDYTAQKAEDARRQMHGEEQRPGIYEKIKKAADSVTHPFRRDQDASEHAKETAKDMYEKASHMMGSGEYEKVPVREGRVVQEL